MFHSCFYLTNVYLGVEFVLVVQDIDLQCVHHSFYMCLLCDKQCNSFDNIITHLESTAHRLLYLVWYLLSLILIAHDVINVRLAYRRDTFRKHTHYFIKPMLVFQVRKTGPWNSMSIWKPSFYELKLLWVS